MQFVRVLENITFCSLFTNCLRLFAISIITVTTNNHPFLFSSETWDAALTVSRCRCFVLVMIFTSFSDSFKCFHIAVIFAALVRASVWSRHDIVQYNLFDLFTYSYYYKRFFCFFRPNNFGCRTFGASLLNSVIYLAVNGTVTRLPVFIQNMLNCVLKMNKAFTGLERHGGKWLMTNFSFWGGVTL